MAKSKPTKKVFHAPPWENGNRGKWHTISGLASLYGRHRNTVFRWIKDGTLNEFRFEVFQDFKGKWWIREPKDQRPTLQ
ncbi:MAG TPA: hypothetical protein VGT24_01575 [Candidatus Acidoferrales bacterium]|nr:hypothetical protein [Candidatus Acidoferrales bacterium]